MNQKRFLKLIRIVVIVVLVGIVSYMVFWNGAGLERVVTDPESGQKILENELIILAPKQDVVLAIKGYDGVITISVPETDSYQVRFPVSDLNELDKIKDDLNNKGLRAVYVILMTPPQPGLPQ